MANNVNLKIKDNKIAALAVNNINMTEQQSINQLFQIII